MMFDAHRSCASRKDGLVVHRETGACRADTVVTVANVVITRAHLVFAAGIVGGALATALSTHVRIPLPFTPVPITPQTMVVLLCGALLGAGGGALSQIVFLALGTAGITTFAGGSLLGVTGGYLIGFVVAAALVGAVARRTDSLLAMGAIMLGASLLILGLGAAWLAQVNGLGAREALMLGVVPFLAGDALKAAAALSAWRVGRLAWRRIAGDADRDD